MVYTPNPSWPLPALPEHNVLALLSGSRWASNEVTYSFPDLRSDYSSGNSAADGFQAANAADQNAVRSILEGDGLRTLSGYMALTSVEQVTSLDLDFAGYNASDISVSTNTDLAQSFAYYPVNGGDVWLRSDIAFPQVGSYSYYLILHELGHSLGLKHGHEADSAVGATNETVLTYDRDTKEFSVMTYRNNIGDNNSYFEDDAEGPSTLMMYDIAALQYLYGADFETNSTDTVYSFDPQSGQVFLDNDFLYAKGDALGDTIFMTIWDGGGIDTYDLNVYRPIRRSILHQGAGRSSPRRSSPISATAIKRAAMSSTRFNTWRTRDRSLRTSSPGPATTTSAATPPATRSTATTAMTPSLERTAMTGLSVDRAPTICAAARAPIFSTVVLAPTIRSSTATPPHRFPSISARTPSRAE